MRLRPIILIAGGALLALHIMGRARTPPKPPPPPPETTCGPVWTGREWGLAWARRHEPFSVGLKYSFARYDAEGHPRRAPAEVGWGAAGAAACRLAFGHDRWALVFGFLDPIDDDAELNLVVLDARGTRLGRHELARQRGTLFEPTSLTVDGDGWRVRYRTDDDGPEEEVRTDRDGRRR